ncbi:unnamed protein product, partial [Meganyctiphanes norvegica]
MNVGVHGAYLKILQHVVENSNNSSRLGPALPVAGTPGSPGQDPSLCECAISLKLAVEANADNYAAMENISIQLSEPQFTLRERLFTFLEHKALAATPVLSPTIQPNKSTPPLHTLLQKYWLFIPLKARLKVDDVGVKLLNNLGQPALQGSLASIDFQTHLTREGALENFPMLLPDFITELQVDNIRIQSTHDSVVTLNRFNVQSQFVGDRVNMKAEFRSLHIFYDHRDLGVWRSYLSRRKSSPPVLISGPPREASGGISSSVNGLSPYCVGIITELWDMSCGGSVPGSPYAQVTLQHARHSFVLTQGVNQMEGELILESLITSVAPSKINRANPAAPAVAPRRVHIWGTPLCIGLCLVQLSSVGSPIPGSGSVGLAALQAEALVDNTQFEWSQDLTGFVIALYKYLVELKSFYKSKNTRLSEATPKRTSPELFNSFSIKCTNINIFAITEDK